MRCVAVVGGVLLVGACNLTLPDPETPMEFLAVVEVVNDRADDVVVFQDMQELALVPAYSTREVRLFTVRGISQLRFRQNGFLIGETRVFDPQEGGRYRVIVPKRINFMQYVPIEQQESEEHAG